MDEGKPGSTPGQASYMGAGGSTPDANTNLDPSLQSGTTPADRQATQDIEQQHTEKEGLSSGLEEQSDPARQMDNSGPLKPAGQGHDVNVIGAGSE
ncbi:MAG: hypothetical protein AB1511_08895, partial [Deinococcota bacterium]